MKVVLIVGRFLCLSASLWVSASRSEAAERTARAAPAAALPISEVILYSSGVGFFQREGAVEERSKLDIPFKVDDINDLLKSMVVQDFNGGHVTTVTYGSRDPLAKTLKSFGIDLTENPSLGQLLNQVRGETVEVMRPGPVTGAILGVEHKQQPVGENKTIQVEFLNLSTSEGLQSIPLAQISRIKLANERLNAELKQALEALATSHDTQKKTVSITFEGEGKRKVAVSYIAQTPVWKTSYRLVLDEKEAPFLQGWAIVENTTDDDWENVRLSLVSGRPISFVMDLYQPLYTTRPVVQPELYLSLRPPVYSDALDKSQDLAALAAPKAAMAPQLAMRSLALAEPETLRRSGGLGGGGFGGGGPLGKSVEAGVAGQAADRERKLRDSVVAAAEGMTSGELFQYSIKAPVTLARQKSALLPIINQKVEGEKLSIYNSKVQSKFPLNGFRLKNKTALHLMQGPITVFDGGSYAGDARIEDLAPEQDRLISYALDLKTEVEPQSGVGQQELLSVKIKKGTLIATRRVSDEKTYQIKNRDQKKKTVLIEHPFRSDWNLVEPKSAAERTREYYRFSVGVEAGQTAKLPLKEEKQLAENVQLINAGSDIIAFYIKSQKASARLKNALQQVVTLRDRASQTASERGRHEQRVNEITQEQSRIRENMARLGQNSELYTRYVKKLDQQESELENLRQQIETLKTTERKQQQELNEYLLNLDVE